MVKNATVGRPDCLTSSLVRRSRDSKVPYHKLSTYPYPTANSPSKSPTSPSASISWRRRSVQIHQESPPDFTNRNTESLGYVNLQSPIAQPSDFGPNRGVQRQAENLWYPSAMDRYTLPTYLLNSPPSIGTISAVPYSSISAPNHTRSTPSNVTPTEIYSNDLQSPWQTLVPTNDTFKSEPDTMSQSFGSFGSFNSLALTINTDASSISDRFACPDSGSSSISPGASSLQDLYLPEGYFNTRHSLDNPSSIRENPNSPRYLETFPFEADLITPDWTYVGDMYTTESVQWSPATATQNRTQEYHTYSEHTQIPNISPWNPQVAQDTRFGENATTGCVTFESPPGLPYETFKIGEEYLRTTQQASEGYVPDPVSPAVDAESDGWQVVSSYPPSTIPSSDSPYSQGSPWSIVGTPPSSSSPPQQHAEPHSHVFSGYPSERKASATRGRQRALTFQEKQEALVVRKAKACWACHLSKIKCSPCSPGSPCQQCARLAGKRRFCWLPCFNDPLEALYTFMAPEYLYGNYSKPKIEKLVSECATSWGTHEMVIGMKWGYRRPVEEVVVALTMRHDSELAYVHHVTSNGPNNRPTVRKKRSPPLGLPLPAMDDLVTKYGNYVGQIVCDDLQEYVSMAYRPKDPELPERLLQTIANFYCATAAAGDKCEMLQQALQVHVTSTILQRSLILDDFSLFMVKNQLQQDYPPRSTALLVQRQVKTAFYEIQRYRVVYILESWGKEMWNSTKHTMPEKKWATTFSVLLTLTLVIDKILASSYSVCETRIKKGADPMTERTSFRNLVRLTEKELFDRCKEIFHSSFKTRKAGKEAYNPIRDAKAAFRGKAVNEAITRFVWDLNVVVREFELEIRSYRSTTSENLNDSPYTNIGRLASIFLADFLDH